MQTILRIPIISDFCFSTRVYAIFNPRTPLPALLGHLGRGGTGCTSLVKCPLQVLVRYKRKPIYFPGLWKNNQGNRHSERDELLFHPEPPRAGCSRPSGSTFHPPMTFRWHQSLPRLELARQHIRALLLLPKLQRNWPSAASTAFSFPVGGGTLH